jgi:uridine kinase
MSPFILALAGGTGSGKSTLAAGLELVYANEVLTVHLDDYFKKPPELPKMGNYLNFDHPDAVYNQRLHDDLLRLKRGESTEITVRDKEASREYDEWEPRKRLHVNPKKLVILEGFLALHYPKLRELYNLSIFLDAPFEKHLSRRVHAMNDGYKHTVLRGMQKYIIESKKHADLVIDVEHADKNTVLQTAISEISPRLA